MKELDQNKLSCSGDGTALMCDIYAHGYVKRDGGVGMQVRPARRATLEEIHAFIVSDKMQSATEQLRSITDKAANSLFKVIHFPFATFACCAAYRNAKSVTSMSGLMVLDVDKDQILSAFPSLTILEGVAKTKQLFVNEKNISFPLVFTSPNGNGVKAVAYIGDRQGLTHRECFDAIAFYLQGMYNLPLDKSGSDVCRACFLSHDKDAYLAPDINNLQPPKVNLSAWLAVKKRRENKYVPHTAHSTPASAASDVFELVERWVSQKVLYAEGTYNNYVMRCGYQLCNFGVSEQEATQWAVGRFGDYDSAQVRAIISSCYRNGQFGTKQFTKR